MRNLVALTLISLPLVACSDGCENTVVARTASPDGRHEAVLFGRSCGATTGFSAQIALVTPGQGPSRASTIFVAESDREAPQRSSAEAAWLGSNHLQIRYDAQAGVFLRQAEMSGVQISYQPMRP